jgi:TonB family protein
MKRSQKIMRLMPAIFPALILIFVLSSQSCQCIKKESRLNKASDGTQQADSREKPEIPFVVVDEMPLFPGGDSALLGFIAKNTKYPESAKNRKAEGRVILRFCVNADGTVSQPSILKGADAELNAEAIRVTESLPRFTPGKQGGRAVPVWYMVPVEFRLN